MIKLSVIIVNYNVQYFLEQCVLSVLAASQNMATEIIVVDNNSSDGSCDLLRSKYPQIRLISNSNNIGFSKANNIGVEEAKGDYILILNPDTVIAEDTLDTVIDFADQRQDVGALGVKFIDGSGRFLPECKRNIPTKKIALNKLVGNTNKYYANQIEENEQGEVAILSGAFMLMKKDVYQGIGGFDPDYFMYGEDVDLSYKLLKKGYKNYYMGCATIVHYKGESSVKDVRYLKHFYKAMEIFYQKHFDINAFIKILSTLFFKFLVIYKSIPKPDIVSSSHQKSNYLLISNDHKLFERLQRTKPSEIMSMTENLDLNKINSDVLIFDSNFMPNKVIIEKIEMLNNHSISKRIVPKKTCYYLGSDHSTTLGEVVMF